MQRQLSWTPNVKYSMPDQHTRAVIFDIDDTLLSASRVKWNHFAEVARDAYGLTLTEAQMRAVWGRPLAEQVHALFGNIDSTDNIYAHLLAAESRF
jgi:beta-phosphoglucomutase-like phosphatase (HAD superfamily)